MIAVLLPCYQRHEQTQRNAARLTQTPGVDAHWVAVVPPNDDALTLPALWNVIRPSSAVTYWQALSLATVQTDATYLVNAANDLLPGADWLARGMRDYERRFGETPGLLGFNDGIHEAGHSPHFLIHRTLLERYGGWPTHYRHEFGDTELCQRAQADGVYAKSAYAVLYHDHPYTGADHDAGYSIAWQSRREDMATFQRRKACGWICS